MNRFVMSVNNAGQGNSARGSADEHATVDAIDFDVREQPRIPVPSMLDLVCAADEYAPRLSDREIDGSSCPPARTLDLEDVHYFVAAVATATARRAVAIAAEG